MGKCIIVGAGDLTVGGITLSEDDFIIAVDGGLHYCGFLQLEPDLILGDFDSLGEEGIEILNQLTDEIPERIIRLNPKKDDTDMLYALKYALEKGYRDFRLYGATGGRLDHTFGNIQCLLFLKNHGASGYLMDGDGMIFVMRDETVRFKPDLEGRLSLFALDKEVKSVSITGMKYNLEAETLYNDYPIGISNEFIGKEAVITVEGGDVLCMVQYVS